MHASVFKVWSLFWTDAGYLAPGVNKEPSPSRLTIPRRLGGPRDVACNRPGTCLYLRMRHPTGRKLSIQAAPPCCAPPWRVWSTKWNSAALGRLPSCTRVSSEAALSFWNDTTTRYLHLMKDSIHPPEREKRVSLPLTNCFNRRKICSPWARPIGKQTGVIKLINKELFDLK